jgi:hypothetical protein
LQENDILSWEKGAYKKWGRSKKKCSDLTLEEMKKQAAVQCLRSASDEVSSCFLMLGRVGWGYP